MKDTEIYAANTELLALNERWKELKGEVAKAQEAVDKARTNRVQVESDANSRIAAAKAQLQTLIENETENVRVARVAVESAQATRDELVKERNTAQEEHNRGFVEAEKLAKETAEPVTE
jgi:hypothetical protein